MKRLLSIGLIALTLAAAGSAAAGNAKAAPEARADAFYTWFIEHDTDAGYPLDLPEIEQYVARPTVERLRNDYAHGGPPGGVDYFLKVQDYDSRDWLAHRTTGPAVMLGAVAVVPITFGSKNPASVLVFMRRIGGIWKITKVGDTWDYR